MPKFGTHAERVFLLRCPDQNIRHRGKRRVLHEAAEVDFFFVEPRVILRSGEAHRVVVRVDGLHVNDAWKMPAPGPARHLGQELESPFGSTKIGHSETDVGRDNPHQRDVRNIVPLGDHLGAHQDIVVALAEVVEDVFKLAFPGDSIAVQPGDPGFRKLSVEFVFHAFRTCTHERNVLALTIRADLRNFLRVATAMAEQTAVPPMPGESNSAVLALNTLTTGSTGYKAGEAAAVQQDHGLFMVRETFTDRIDKSARKNPVFTRFEELLSHIDEVHRGHGPVCNTLGHFEQSVLAVLGIKPAFETWRGGAENDARTSGLRSHDGDIATVVPWCLFLLVAAIVFFVNQDKTEVVHRGEHPGPSPHHDLRSTGVDSAPLVSTFRIRKRGVQNGHPVTEACVELTGYRRGERDFRHHQQRPATGCQSGVDGIQIDLRLTGPSDAVEQERAEFPGFDAGVDQVKGPALAGVEVVRGANRRTADRHRLGGEGDKLATRERAGRGAGILYQVLQFSQIVRSRVERKKGEEFAFGFGKFSRRSGAGEGNAEFRRRRAEGVAIRIDLLHGHPSFAEERFQGSVGKREFALQMWQRQRPVLQHRHHLVQRVVSSGCNRELFGSVATRVGKRIDLTGADVVGQRQHGAENFAEGRAVVARNPASQREQFVAENRLFVKKPEQVFDRNARRVVVNTQRHTGQLSGTERRDHSGTGFDAVLQGQRQRVREGLIDRDRQADIAIARQDTSLTGGTGARGKI